MLSLFLFWLSSNPTKLLLLIRSWPYFSTVHHFSFQRSSLNAGEWSVSDWWEVLYHPIPRLVPIFAWQAIFTVRSLQCSRTGLAQAIAASTWQAWSKLIYKWICSNFIFALLIFARHTQLMLCLIKPFITLYFDHLSIPICLVALDIISDQEASLNIDRKFTTVACSMKPTYRRMLPCELFCDGKWQ